MIMTPVLCQCCGKNPATIHITDIKDDTKRELHICESCANEQGIGTGAIVPGILVDLIQGGAGPAERAVSLRCPHCGVTFDDFRTKGRFGCPRDYEVFEEALNPLLDKIHGAHQHTGRLPRGRRAVDTDTADRLLRLRRELQEAVRKEDYENAARIRDTIREVETNEAETAAPGGGTGDESGRGSH